MEKILTRGSSPGALQLVPFQERRLNLIAAIYARKSTRQNLPDAEKSVTRRVEHATAYAARKGWTVDPAHATRTTGSPAPSS
jgi:hypothetical protein